MPKNKTIGLLLVFSPFILGLISALLYIYGVRIGGESLVALRIIRLVAGLSGILAFLAIFGGLPAGIYFLVKKPAANNTSATPGPSYPGLSAEQTAYLGKWSWGAFFGGVVWALGNKLYLWALGYFVPFYGLYVWINLAANGRRLAYQKGWANFDQFKKRQKIMAIIVAILAVISIYFSYSDWRTELKIGDPDAYIAPVQNGVVTDPKGYEIIKEKTENGAISIYALINPSSGPESELRTHVIGIVKDIVSQQKTKNFQIYIFDDKDFLESAASDQFRRADAYTKGKHWIAIYPTLDNDATKIQFFPLTSTFPPSYEPLQP